MADDQVTDKLQLTSSAFTEGNAIPVTFTCKGENVNPPLTVNGVPSNAKSLAMILHDPDAPSGDWVHWLVWNINPSIIEIPQGSLPVGAVEGTTSFGKTGYGGPCPPSGTHHYIFELYTLNTTLDLPQTTTREQLESAMNANILAQTKLTGTFSAD